MRKFYKSPMNGNGPSADRLRTIIHAIITRRYGQSRFERMIQVIEDESKPWITHDGRYICVGVEWLEENHAELWKQATHDHLSAQILEALGGEA